MKVSSLSVYKPVGTTLVEGLNSPLLRISGCLFDQSHPACLAIPPRFVQNRCYAAQGWDRQLREFCVANGIVYQAFSLLTANREVMASAEMHRIAECHGRTVAQIVFRFATNVGMIPLTGTTDSGHMRADLDIDEFQLGPDEVERIARINER